MTWLADPVLRRLREAAAAPDLSATRYELVAILGRGGMATVYLARDRDLGREVALKVLDLPEPWSPAAGAAPGPGPATPPASATDGAERLAREARVLARLEHPGIVPVHEAGRLPDGRAFYAMRRVRGSRLDAWAATASLPEILRAFERACEAVAFAHAHGVLHRDLKPANVMVGPFGEVLVLDWGIAKLVGEGPEGISKAPTAPPERPLGGAVRARAAGEAAAGTLAGTVLGTPGFMAPEQERGEIEGLSERTDVYGLGAILGALLGERGVDEVPRPLRAIVARATAPLPADRYAGAEALAADLRRYLEGAAVSAHREGPLERGARWLRRYRTPIVLILTYLLVRAILLAWTGR